MGLKLSSRWRHIDGPLEKMMAIAFCNSWLLNKLKRPNYQAASLFLSCCFPSLSKMHLENYGTEQRIAQHGHLNQCVWVFPSFPSLLDAWMKQIPADPCGQVCHDKCLIAHLQRWSEVHFSENTSFQILLDLEWMGKFRSHVWAATCWEHLLSEEQTEIILFSH